MWGRALSRACPRQSRSIGFGACLYHSRLWIRFRILAPCNANFPKSLLVGVGAIIIQDSCVLLVKRAHPPLQAQWSIPGGVLEIGELVREAAIREAREETGLIVQPGELLGVYDRILRNSEQRVQYHYVLIDFLCRRVGGDLAAASDAAEVRWFTADQLPPLNLAEDTLDVIHKGFAMLDLINGMRIQELDSLDSRSFESRNFGGGRRSSGG